MNVSHLSEVFFFAEKKSAFSSDTFFFNEHFKPKDVVFI